MEAPKIDFDEWIRDGKILCRVFAKLVFNSVPRDIVDVPTNDVKVSSSLKKLSSFSLHPNTEVFNEIRFESADGDFTKKFHKVSDAHPKFAIVFKR